MSTQVAPFPRYPYFNCSIILNSLQGAMSSTPGSSSSGGTFIASLYPGSLLTATGLALHGYRKGSLSRSGAIAAFCVGYGHLAGPVKVFGITMIVFYLIGSRATKVKADVKAKLEDGIDPTKPSGNRSATQVLAAALPSLVAALVFRHTYQKDLLLDTVPLLSRPLATGLIYAALGHIASSLADTLASELGILSSTPPRYILTGQPCPPGTNGGISTLGLGVSALGGAMMGLTMVLDLLVECPALRGPAMDAVGSWSARPGGVGGWGWAWRMVAFGTAAGLAGSLLDSLLGATMQETLYSSEDKRILTDASTRSRTGSEIKRIGCGRDVVSNATVNFITGATMAAVGWYWINW